MAWSGAIPRLRAGRPTRLAKGLAGGLHAVSQRRPGAACLARGLIANVASSPTCSHSGAGHTLRTAGDPERGIRGLSAPHTQRPHDVGTG